MAITTLGDGRYVEVNDAFVEITGYTWQEVVGRTAKELNIWADLQERGSIIGELFEKGYIRNSRNVKYRSKYGEIRPFLVSLEIIYIDKMPHVLWALKDISSLRRSEEALRQSEERFCQAFHASPVMMTITRFDDGVIVNANRKFCEIFRCSAEEVIGHTYEDLGLYDNERRREILALLEKTGTVTNYEGSVQFADGNSCTCLISLCIIQISGEKHILTHGIDITERKQIEHALKE